MRDAAPVRLLASGALILAGAVLFAGSATAAGTANVRQVPNADSGPAEPPLRRSAASDLGNVAVTIDRAKIIRLPERTATVIVGNPAIADITIQRNAILVVTGKSYGATNLIAMDAGGNMLAESTISVTAPTESLVIVQRGLERESYSCTPNCQPSILLGDSQKYFSETRGQANARNGMATQR
jgi:Flp pilus assembly secretin CpaC